METKELKFNEAAKESIQKGINTLANAVKITLGPKGRNVIIERKDKLPQITKDGVTVAKAINLEDKFENIGAQLVKSVAEKTNDDVGDGTTTATVLAQAIVNVGITKIKEGVNPIILKKGIDIAVNSIVKCIENQAIQINRDPEKIKHIATISANNDEKIGKLITEAVIATGEYGIVNIEEGTSVEDSLTVTPGMQFDRGYFSPHFTNTSKRTIEFNNPLIFLSNEKITKNADIFRLLEYSANNNRELLIIAEGLEGEAQRTIIMNVIDKKLKVAFVKSPAFGDRRKETMDDISILVGAKIVDRELGTYFPSFNIEELGSCKKVIITKDDTTIIEGNGNSIAIKTRINWLKTTLDTSKFDWEKEIAKQRLAKMIGKVAIISVGAINTVELKERKDRIEDALNATKAAISEGIVPGGGTTLIRCLKILNELHSENKDETIGINIIKDILTIPLTLILKNSGIENSRIKEIVDHSLKLKGYGGYNAYTDKFEDLIKSGVIDPAKVTRIAIQNASSIAGLFLTTECVIAIKEKKEDIQNFPY